MKTRNTKPRFTITKDEPRQVGGTWITGMIDGLKFQALVFAEHADCESYELGFSRISKISLQDAKGTILYSFDRGLDVEAQTTKAAKALNNLIDHLANKVFPDQK